MKIKKDPLWKEALAFYDHKRGTAFILVIPSIVFIFLCLTFYWDEFTFMSVVIAFIKAFFLSFLMPTIIYLLIPIISKKKILDHYKKQIKLKNYWDNELETIGKSIKSLESSIMDFKKETSNKKISGEKSDYDKIMSI